MRRDCTLTIPTIPPRESYLRRAITSGQQQTEPLAGYSVAVDLNHEGAWTTRNRAVMGVTTEWTALLDDDDELFTIHCQFLLDRAEEHGLDMCWGWFEVRGGVDPFPMYKGLQYTPDDPHIFPITVMVRTELIQDAVREMGGFQPDGQGAWDQQDMPVWNWIHASGAKMMAFEERTWFWNHTGYNTSGLPNRW
jgi:hypothetical protein